jgi:hypothetical protein
MLLRRKGSGIYTTGRDKIGLSVNLSEFTHKINIEIFPATHKSDKDTQAVRYPRRKVVHTPCLVGV